MKRKVIAILLVFLLILTSVPLNVFAVDEVAGAIATESVLNQVYDDELMEVGVYGIPVPLAAEGGSVRLQETGELFDTLREAIIGAGAQGLDNFTLEVIGDVIEGSTAATRPVVTSNVTIVGAEGKHTVTLPANVSYILVQNGGSLTLGDGTNENLLTINALITAVQITDGEAHIRDGVRITGDHSNAATVLFNGANVQGSISGGIIEGNRAAVRVYGGARITEISGGELIGQQIAVEMDSSRTPTSRIDLISGGRFIQWDYVGSGGFALYVQNDSWVGEITGGYFEATRTAAIYIIRGGWIETISGGEFVMTRVLSGPTGATRTSALYIDDGFAYDFGYNPKTGVGTISGGHFHGGHFGIVSIMEGSQIHAITGGIFEGRVALQNDRGYGLGSVINEISGGTFIGNQGLLNNSIIEHIGGTAEFHGTSSYGIYNFPLGGVIKEISGGTIISDNSYGILNAGTIELISGGRIEGSTAISNAGLTDGRLGTITGGVFWGRNSTAIILAYELILEPDLTTERRGFGRYWGNDGVIFNDESLVVYPDSYRMSTRTLPVEGIEGADFKYLTLPEYEVIVEGSYADITGAGVYLEGETVTINAGSRDGFTFAGWTTSDDVTFADPNNATTTFVMPAQDFTVTANWDEIVIPTYTVTVENSHAEDTGAGTYLEGETVTINAGSRDGFTFAGWATSDDVTFADPNNATTTFVMPAQDVIVTANWRTNSGSGGGGGGGETPPPSPEVVTPEKPEEPETERPSPEFVVTFTGDHEAYLIGFPDGTIKPNSTITRAEVATIFFRLLEDNYRIRIWSQSNPFRDVAVNNWFNNAVSTLANANIIEGFPDGTFKGNQAITRAEFVTIISRFVENPGYTGANMFNDISGHWAQDAINVVGYFEWINGFGDGSFRPNQNIIRAEAAAIVNRMLERQPESVEDLLPGMVVWPDNTNQNAWFYLDIQEATNSHDFEMKADEVHERWIELREPRDWTVLERPNSRPQDIL